MCRAEAAEPLVIPSDGKVTLEEAGQESCSLGPETQSRGNLCGRCCQSRHVHVTLRPHASAVRNWLAIQAATTVVSLQMIDWILTDVRRPTCCVTHRMVSTAVHGASHRTTDDSIAVDHIVIEDSSMRRNSTTLRTSDLSPYTSFLLPHIIDLASPCLTSRRLASARLTLPRMTLVYGSFYDMSITCTRFKEKSCGAAWHPAAARHDVV